MARNLLPIKIQRKGADVHERKTGPHERPKGKGRAETPLLPAPGENAGAPDTRTDP